MPHDPYLAIDAVLTTPAKNVILKYVGAADPQLIGATVADVLDMYDSVDGCSTFMESPFWDTPDGEAFKAAAQQDHIPVNFMRVAGIAVCLILGNGEEPNPFTAQFMYTLAHTAFTKSMVAGGSR